ncbi:hypothetical protein PG5_59710 [Pseudomonas sp. G5(2012)]|nr:hypothetical protein PG5_59710 [Pseudomonas sp. G5(2012)]
MAFVVLGAACTIAFGWAAGFSIVPIASIAIYLIDAGLR